MVRPALIAAFTYLLGATGPAMAQTDQAGEAAGQPAEEAGEAAGEEDNALYESPDGESPLFGEIDDPERPPTAAPDESGSAPQPSASQPTGAKPAGVQPTTPAPTATRAAPGEPASAAPEAPDDDVDSDALDAPRQPAPAKAGERKRLDADAEGDAPGASAKGGQARWDNADEMGKMIGYGSMGVCEAVTTPLSLIPSVGSIIGFVLEIACLYPGALSVDYVALFHGERDSQLWQAATAVILAKAWRVGTRFAAIGAIVAAGAITLGAGAVMLGGVGVTAFLGGANWLTAVTPLVWAPTMVGTVLVLAGGTYIGLRKVRKWGQSKIYDWVYLGLTDEFKTKADQKAAQQKAYVYPPLSWWERAWVLMAMADGSEAESDPVHWIPVAGRVIKAGDQAEALKKNMRTVGKDMLDEEPEELQAMDATIDTLAAFEGGLGALAEAALIGGGVLCTIGLAMTAAYFFLDSNLLLYGLATTGIGLAGMTAGGAGVTFLLLREVPRFLRPFLVPLGYGPVPYSWLEDEQGADAAASDDATGDDVDDREME